MSMPYFNGANAFLVRLSVVARGIHLFLLNTICLFPNRISPFQPNSWSSTQMSIFGRTSSLGRIQPEISTIN